MDTQNSKTDRPRCAGVTKAGTPCMRISIRASGFCAWHDEGGIPQRNRPAKPLGPKPCHACGRTLARRLFPPTGQKSPLTGEAYGGPVCRDCLAKQRRADGKRERHQRFNARGEAWCNRCERYLPRERFKPHPSRPHTLWSYCTDCVHQLDRERYHRTKFRADKAAGAFERTKRKARRRKQELRDRADFVLRSIDTVRRRGFTLSETCRLLRVSIGQFYQWRDHGQLPSSAIAHRCAEVLIATGHLPIGSAFPVRRRLPHPELAALLAATEGIDERHPVRNRWKRRGKVTEMPGRKGGRMKPWEQPTPEQTQYVAALRNQLRLPIALLDAHCVREFGHGYAHVTKWECSRLIDTLKGWQAIPADLQRLQGQQDLFSL